MVIKYIKNFTFFIVNLPYQKLHKDNNVFFIAKNNCIFFLFHPQAFKYL